MDSTTLQRRIDANPHNLPGIPDSPCLCPHDYQAARFEREGRNAYPHGRNPYSAGTMANERWARGWHQRDAAVIALNERREARGMADPLNRLRAITAAAIAAGRPVITERR